MLFIRPEMYHPPLPPCVATVGFFDGVHKGHQYLIRQVLHYAEENHMPSALVTFERSPREVVQPGYVSRLLCTPEEKFRRLAFTGADMCMVLNFSPDMAKFSAYDFMEKVLRDHFNVRVLVIGYDHRFGHNRAEGFEDYCRYGKELGMKVVHAGGYTLEGEKVSSSVIRRLLENGDVEQANRMLGYDYTLSGTVVKGFQIGRTIQFPTANMQPEDVRKLIPAGGVYAVWVSVEGKRYKGMLNIGTRPTVHNGSQRTIETHILNFNEDIYGESFSLSFVKRIRSEQCFENLALLREQLEKDKAMCDQLLLE